MPFLEQTSYNSTSVKIVVIALDHVVMVLTIHYGKGNVDIVTPILIIQVVVVEEMVKMVD